MSILGPDKIMRKLEGLVLLLDHAAHQRAGPRIVAHTDPFQLMRVEDNICTKTLQKMQK